MPRMARRRSRARTAASSEKPPAPAPAAPDWDPDVPAQAQTWMYLFLKGEVLTSFPDSRELRMRQMAWWNGLATPDVRRIDAEKVAIALHRFFKDAMRRPYETEFEKNGFPKSIMALTEVLVVADETLPALAGVVDRIFRFENEA
jgi:hypothetical protein